MIRRRSQWGGVSALLLGAAITLTACSPPSKKPEAKAPTVETAAASLAYEGELIVLAAPLDNDAYYADYADAIFDFHVGFAKAVKAPDRVLVLTGPGYYDRYADALGEGRVFKFTQGDIWLRDFAPVQTPASVMMRYTAAGQGGGSKGQSNADAVQDGLADLIKKARLKIGATDLLNDGGNVVSDGAGRLVVSRKFLRDNALSVKEGRTALRRRTGATEIAFIESDEQGGLEHADGVAAFIGPNTLVINQYPDDPDYADALKKSLRSGLPDVTIHEIVTPYDASNVFDERFGSACGLYTNMLVTAERIYLPIFGTDHDKAALSQLHQWTDKDIVPVGASEICRLGGGVRCMSWQVSGKNADRLIAFVEKEKMTP